MVRKGRQGKRKVLYNMPIKKKVIKKTAKKPVKKVVKKPTKKPAQKKEKQIGKVVHYFDKIKVAVIEFNVPIKIGDTIRIEGGTDTDFKQTVKSMQVDHKSVKSVKKGKEAGMKVKEKVREGYKVFKA